ncbi:hypothetical protein VVS222_00457 [Vibrio vulnificus]|nr:hypothetical protein VVS222_00457 [Vibrio vulnificus]
MPFQLTHDIINAFEKLIFRQVNHFLIERQFLLEAFCFTHFGNAALYTATPFGQMVFHRGFHSSVFRHHH